MSSKENQKLAFFYSQRLITQKSCSTQKTFALLATSGSYLVLTFFMGFGQFPWISISFELLGNKYAKKIHIRTSKTIDVTKHLASRYLFSLLKNFMIIAGFFTPTRYSLTNYVYYFFLHTILVVSQQLWSNSLLRYWNTLALQIFVFDSDLIFWKKKNLWC